MHVSATGHFLGQFEPRTCMEAVHSAETTNLETKCKEWQNSTSRFFNFVWSIFFVLTWWSKKVLRALEFDALSLFLPFPITCRQKYKQGYSWPRRNLVSCLAPDETTRSKVIQYSSIFHTKRGGIFNKEHSCDCIDWTGWWAGNREVKRRNAKLQWALCGNYLHERDPLGCGIIASRPDVNGQDWNHLKEPSFYFFCAITGREREGEVDPLLSMCFPFYCSCANWNHCRGERCRPRASPKTYQQIAFSKCQNQGLIRKMDFGKNLVDVPGSSKIEPCRSQSKFYLVKHPER